MTLESRELEGIERRYRDLELESPAFQLSRILELDYPFRPYDFRKGRLRPAEPSILRDLSDSRAPASLCFRLFRQTTRHWIEKGLGSGAALLRDIDGLSDKNQDPRLLLKSGRLRQCVGRLTEAPQDLEKVLHSLPHLAHARAWMGEVWVQMGDAERGLHELEIAARSLPGDAWALAWSAEARRLTGDREGARRYLKRALDLKPRCAELHVLMGRDGYIPALDRAVVIDPACFWAFILRGHHRHRQGDYTGAEKDFSRAIRLDSNSVWAYVMRARSRFSQGNPALAEKDLDAAIGLDPASFVARHRDIQRVGFFAFRPRGAPLHWIARQWPHLQDELRKGESWTYAALAEYQFSSEFSLKYIRAGLKVEPDSPLLVAFLARALPRQGNRRLPESLKAITRAAEIAPDVGWIYAWRAEILRLAGDLRGALRALNRTARLAPTYYITPYWRGKIKRLLGDFPGALADCDRARDLFGDEVGDTVGVYTEGCLALRGVGRPLDAARAFCRERLYSAAVQFCEPEDNGAAVREMKKLLRKRPRDAGARTVLADLFLRAGKDREALAACEQALSADSECLAACLTRAQAYLRQGRPREALRSLNVIVRRRPFSLSAYAMRGVVYFRMGLWKAAVKDLDLLVHIFVAWEIGFHALRGRIHRLHLNLRKAKSQLEERLLVVPWEPWTLYEYALCLMALGDVPGALNRLRRVGLPSRLICGSLFPYLELEAEQVLQEDFLSLSAKKGSAFAWGWKGAVLVGMGREQEAIECWDRAAAASGADWCLAWKGNVLLQRGKTSEAIVCLDKALKDQPRFAWALALRGKAKLMEGLKAEGLGDLDRALGLEGDLEDAYGERAREKLGVGDLPGALSDADHAVAINSRNSWAYFLRAQILLRSGKPEAALQDLDEALLLDPDYGHAYLLRANCHALLGRLSPARKDLGQAQKRSRQLALRP